jgi:hypothetical protein
VRDLTQMAESKRVKVGFHYGEQVID